MSDYWERKDAFRAVRASERTLNAFGPTPCSCASSASERFAASDRVVMPAACSARNAGFPIPFGSSSDGAFSVMPRCYHETMLHRRARVWSVAPHKPTASAPAIPAGYYACSGNSALRGAPDRCAPHGPERRRPRGSRHPHKRRLRRHRCNYAGELMRIWSGAACLPHGFGTLRDGVFVHYETISIHRPVRKNP